LRTTEADSGIVGSWWALKLAPYFRTLTAREDAEHFLFIGAPNP
jgi:hypothetical protein